MKLKFTNGKSFLLPDNIEPEERLVEINKVLESTLKFHGEEMTVEEYFRYTWDKDHTRTTLDRISFYLAKMPEQSGQHDKEIISRNDDMEMVKGVRWVNRNGEKTIEKARYINHSDLKIEQKVELGLVEDVEVSV